MTLVFDIKRAEQEVGKSSHCKSIDRRPNAVCAVKTLELSHVVLQVRATLISEIKYAHFEMNSKNETRRLNSRWQ